MTQTHTRGGQHLHVLTGAMQQQPLDSGNQVPALARHLTQTAINANNPQQQSVPQSTAGTNQQPSLPKALQLRAMDLNTRTMFFQPPPHRLWQDENATSSSEANKQTVELDSQNISGGKNNDSDNRADGANYSRGDSNDQVYIQRSSETVPYQHDTNTHNPSLPITTDNGGTDSLSKSQHPQPQPQQSSLLTLAPNASNGYKRGTIIASATSSPTRGYGTSSSSQIHHRLLKIGGASTSIITGSSWLATSAIYLAWIIEILDQLSNTPLISLILSCTVTISYYHLGLNHDVAFYFT